MSFPRSSGILLHPTSLPGRYGIGDLGGEAYRFVDFLADTKQTLWQVLPLGPTGYGNSPYMCYSALAGNPLLISPDKLREVGLLDDGDLADVPDFSPDRVDYDRVRAYKMTLFGKAYRKLKSHANDGYLSEFHNFCTQKASWLDEFALFMALKTSLDGKSWHQWEPGLAKRDPNALQSKQQVLSDEIEFQQFLQFEFFRQWKSIKAYANDRRIEIIGDIPIYVAHDSADVWANPSMFCLDEQSGEPALMAGVPPDYFSNTGQLWGNPVYNWENLKQTNFAWWVQRFEAILEYVDIIRIDHFRGFEAFWAVRQGETTAINGEWIKAPGQEFFQVLGEKLGKLPIMAEDLGVITPEMEALRDEFEFPGMKILHFAFGSGAGNPYLPFCYPKNCVVYTGTHDNDTTVGWIDKFSEAERQGLLSHLGYKVSEAGLHWDLIRIAWSSVANQAIAPLQDILGLGSEARMNYPSKPQDNWEWRFHSWALDDEERRHRLRTLTDTYGRSR